MPRWLEVVEVEVVESSILGVPGKSLASGTPGDKKNGTSLPGSTSGAGQPASQPVQPGAHSLPHLLPREVRSPPDQDPSPVISNGPKYKGSIPKL